MKTWEGMAGSIIGLLATVGLYVLFLAIVVGGPIVAVVWTLRWLEVIPPSAG